MCVAVRCHKIRSFGNNQTSRSSRFTAAVRCDCNNSYVPIRFYDANDFAQFDKKILRTLYFA